MFVLPREYHQVTKVKEPEENINDEMTRHRLVCYYVMNNKCMEEQNDFFERPDEAFKSHLKPPFVRGKVENVPINNILVDGGATLNLMLHTILKKLGKTNMDTTQNHIT